MSVHINDLARQVVADDPATASQCRTLINWMFAEFEWSATDYQHRTVEEILVRRAGNCAEQAMVLNRLLRALDIDTREIAEINIQPPRAERGRRAEQMAAERGPAASVFGHQHNDHRWLEVYDPSSATWFPADATLGLCGDHEWLMARMGFGSRPAVAQDMIVPIMVFVMDTEDRVLEDRTDHYVVELFARYIEARTRATNLLDDWRRVVHTLAQAGQRAFEGRESFFAYRDQIQQALDVYRAIESAYREAQ